MPSFLDELDTEIAAQGGRRRGAPARRAGAVSGGAAPRRPGDAVRTARGRGAIRPAVERGGARRRRVRAFGTLDYRVPEPVLVIAQPRTMACWATALTILYSWRDRQSRTIEDVTSEVGAGYRTLYDDNRGLSATDKDSLMRDAGLGAISATSLGADDWLELMRRHGPVWITTREGASVHGRILHGIHGDGTSGGTTLDIIDPSGGRQYTESVSTFLPKFEAEAIAGNTDRVNVVFLQAGRPAAMGLPRRALATRRARSAALTSAASAIDVQVPGIVPLVAQPTDMTCWAASYTMLENWSENRSVGIEVALGNIGAEWVERFRKNQGLSGRDTGRFVAAAGLHAEPAASYTVEAWADLLRESGPLLIVTDEAPGTGWAVHARVIHGVRGDGTASGTVLKIHDPAPVGRGSSFEESVATFLPKYEQMAAAAGFPGLQILHFPADAQLSVSRSLRGAARVRGVASPRSLATLPSARVLAERLGGNLPDRVSELVAGGVAEAAIRDFLMQLLPGRTAATPSPEAQGRRRARAFRVAEGTTVTLPTGVVLEGWQAALFIDAVLSAMSMTVPTAPALFRGLQTLADTLDVTVGLGAAAGAAGSAGAGAGLGLGAGILIAPGRRIGFYGSLEHSIEGFALGGSITLQLTVVKGGPSVFSGRSVTVGGAIGEGLVGGGRMLFPGSGQDREPIGFVAAIGIGAGLSPAEFTASIQDTVSSLGLPGLSVGLGADDPAVARAARFGAEVVATVERLLADGVASDDIQAFLERLSPDSAAVASGFVVPFGGEEEESGEERFEVHLPGSTVLEGWRAELFLATLAAWAALPSMGAGFLPIYLLMRGIRALCNSAGVTIAIGPSVSGGVASGGSLGAGLLFAPGDRVGFYGSSAFLNGALASIEGTIQVTLLHGGPELMDGSAVAVGGAVSAPSGVSPVGGFYVLLNGERFVGVMVEIGVSAGLAPFETLAQFQYSSQSVGAQGFSAASSLAGLWSRSASGRRGLSYGQSYGQSWSARQAPRQARALQLPNLSAWQHLIRFQPSAAVSRALYEKMGSIVPGPLLWDGWPVQQLDRAAGPINLDYYPIRVRAMPAGKSAPELLEEMRLNLNGLVDNRYANFEPYDDGEGEIWSSDSPEGAVIHIDMRMGAPYANPDDGSVACTRKAADHWIFSTIWSIDDLAHPVSGNRQFGYVQNDDGGITLYTRGADRPTRLIDDLVGDTVFSGAHSLWMSFQQGVKRWIDGAGGAADILSPTSDRHDWEAVKGRYG